MLVFGLDWDGTAAEAQDIFLQFCKNVRAQGNKVYIVTMRYESEGVDIPQEFIDNVDGIYFTGKDGERYAKGPYMESKGIKVHIWIDDNPRAINETATQIWGTCSPEGHVVSVNHSEE